MSVPGMPEAFVLRRHCSIWVMGIKSPLRRHCSIWVMGKSHLCLFSVMHREDAGTGMGVLRVQV